MISAMQEFLRDDVIPFSLSPTNWPNAKSEIIHLSVIYRVS